MTNKRVAVGVLAAAGILVAAAAERGDDDRRPHRSPTASSELDEPVDLAAVCPETIVIQTDWFPESEYGAVYNLLGDDYEIDVDNKIVSGVADLGGTADRRRRRDPRRRRGR